MLLGSNKPINTTSPGDHNNESLFIFLLHTNRYAEAYSLLQTAETGVATLFNKALCLFYINNYTQTIRLLDEALSMLLITPQKQLFIEDEIQKLLAAEQNQTFAYRQAVTKQYVRYFPDVMKDTIVRFKIDAYLLLEQWNKVIELGTTIRNKDYKNVIIAIEIAKTKIR